MIIQSKIIKLIKDLERKMIHKQKNQIKNYNKHFKCVKNILIN